MPSPARVTVPDVPDGLRPPACWRRTITALDSAQRGGYAVQGEQLPAGKGVLLPAGTLLLSVDRRTVGVAVRQRNGQFHAPEDATVTVYLVGPDGLEERWQRHFMSARSAFGATTMKMLAALLDEHPPPAGGLGEVVVQRPNDAGGLCRWCGGHVARGAGHQSSPQDELVVEHWQTCPHRRADEGEVCTVCGRPVTGSMDAYAELVREPGGSGRWETRHAPYRDCAHNPQPTPQDLRTRRAEEQAAAERAREEERQRAGERARAQNAEERAVRAEDGEVSAFLALTGETAATAAGAPVRALGKTLRDGRRFALYLIPTAGRPEDWEMVVLLAGQIAGDPFVRRPHRNAGPSVGPGLTHVQPLPPAAGGERRAVGLTEAEARQITTAIRDWEQRPARALRAAVPGAPTWTLDFLLDRPPVGVILHDPRAGLDGIVMSTKARRIEEDGWSFGLMAEQGWLYVATMREPTPTEQEGAQRFDPR